MGFGERKEQVDGRETLDVLKGNIGREEQTRNKMSQSWEHITEYIQSEGAEIYMRD